MTTAPNGADLAPTRRNRRPHEAATSQQHDPTLNARRDPFWTVHLGLLWTGERDEDELTLFLGGVLDPAAKQASSRGALSIGGGSFELCHGPKAGPDSFEGWRDPVGDAPLHVSADLPHRPTRLDVERLADELRALLEDAGLVAEVPTVMPFAVVSDGHDWTDDVWTWTT